VNGLGEHKVAVVHNAFRRGVVVIMTRVTMLAEEMGMLEPKIQTRIPRGHSQPRCHALTACKRTLSRAY
jgi:hypothetical protein